MIVNLAPHLGLFLLETSIVAGAILLMFHFRRAIGLSPLYITLGAFQYLQVVLVLSVYVRVGPGLFVSPGSAVLFSAGLFAILLVYIREDALEARKLIYGLIFANIIISLISVSFGLHLRGPSAVNTLGIPIELLSQNPRVLLMGTGALVIDVLLIVVVYEGLSRIPPRFSFFRVFFSLAGILTLDSLLFVTGAFWGQPQLGHMLLSSILGKVSGAAVFSIFLQIYISKVESNRGMHLSEKLKGADVFQFLTYRQKYEEVLESAQRDSLTGLFNRGFFDESLPLQIHRAKRKNNPISLLMIDIDSFKSINDTHGHQMGDKVLRCYASQMAGRLRASDIACRYGGEEFVVILPEATRSEASMIAESLRNQARFSCSGRGLGCPIDFSVTATVGVAVFPDDGESGDELIRVADERLYRGKRSGRDQVVAD